MTVCRVPGQHARAGHQAGYAAMAYENGGDLPEGAADGGGDTLSEMEHEETSNGNGNSIHENQAGLKEEEAGEGGADGGDDGSVGVETHVE